MPPAKRCILGLDYGMGAAKFAGSCKSLYDEIMVDAAYRLMMSRQRTETFVDGEPVEVEADAETRHEEDMLRWVMDGMRNAGRVERERHAELYRRLKDDLQYLTYD